MKKYFYLLAALLMMGVMSVTMTSCGDDDDPEQGGQQQGGGQQDEPQAPLTVAEAKAVLEGQGLWEFVDEESFHHYFYFRNGKMGAFADDSTPEEVDYQLESASGDFRSGAVKMMAGETVLEVVSYRSLSDASVTLEISEGAWLTYSAYKEKTPQGVTYVDLGLPSGTLWANMNVGASKSEDYGNYYAWGETETKEDFSWATYKWFDNKVDGYFTKYKKDGDDELEPQDDAAYAHWGTGWCMPSELQIEELCNKNLTNCERVEQNGVYGSKITSKVEGYEGNSIFVPAAGYFTADGKENAGHQYADAAFWARTRGDSDTPYPFAFVAENKEVTAPHYFSHYCGLPVRPVRRLPKQK